MPRRWFKFPVWQSFIGNDAAYEWYLPLEIRTANRGLRRLRFLLDTGSQLTTIPIAEAERYQIPFARQRPVNVRGTTGASQGFLAPMWFSLRGLPDYPFESLCCFSASPVPRILFCLKDLITHFRLRTLLPSHLHPLGSLLLQLHSRHKGQPRSGTR